MYALCAKFNDALNNAAVRSDQHILTVNACATSAHFDHFGNLSPKGKRAFWNDCNVWLNFLDDSGELSNIINRPMVDIFSPALT